MSFRFWSRSALVLTVAMPLGLSGGGSAQAQRGCGPDYSIAIGDTLSEISRACGVSERALRRANPQIDWDLLRIGAPVNIPVTDRPNRGRAEPSRDGGRAPRGGPAGVYVVEPGDTLRSVAAALGVDVAALRAANPGLRQRDLVPGREIRLGGGGDGGPRRSEDDDLGRPPRGDGGPRDGGRGSNGDDFSSPRSRDIDVSVDERSVEPGEIATVRVAGLPPRVPVVVRAGPARSDFSIEANGRSRRDGTARIELEIPRRARPGARWIVEVLDPRGRPVAESSFRIDGSERRSRTVSGFLTGEGVECQALRTDDGELYTLSGRLRRFRTGDPVTVTGRIAEASTCQQGTTIEIERIESR